jgi:hypothetical protein
MAYNENLPIDQQGTRDPWEADPRELLYDDYALPHESLEDFCDRMADEHGQGWVNKFTIISKHY